MARFEFTRPQLVLLIPGLVLLAGIALWFASNISAPKDTAAADLPTKIQLHALQMTESLPRYPEVGDLDLEETLDGEPFVVNFFASWCKGCREEHPNLLAFHEANRSTILGLAYNDRAEAAAAYLDQHASPYLAVSIDKGSVNAENFGVMGLPETYIVLSDGTLFHRTVGPLTGERLTVFQDKWSQAKSLN